MQGSTAPLINAQPLGQSQVSGLDATFAVDAAGTPPLSYQWQFNGADIPGATGSSYTVVNVQATNVGNYSVVITNVAGSIVSSNAPLDFGEVTSWGSAGSANRIAISVPIGTSNVLAIAAGNYWGLVLKSDGTISAWGWSTYGQTNLPQAATNVLSVDAGEQHGLMLKGDGTVEAWAGDSFYGETNVPAGLSNVVCVRGGSTESLALRADGTAVGWGYGTATNVPADFTNAVAVDAGGYFGLGLKADGTVVTWGGPPVPTNLASVVAISAGGGFSVALLSNGTVSAWGQNTYGEISVPPGLSNVVAISCGGFHTLALRADGTVVSWGLPLSVTNLPARLTNVIAVAAGEFDSLALVGNGPPVLRASVSDVSFSGNGFRLKAPSQSGKVYQLQYKNSAEDASWTSLPLVAGSGKTITLADGTAGNSPHRIYRVLRW
jgi:alpha-tubulin suppressor-like RCC1 family protein